MTQSSAPACGTKGAAMTAETDYLQKAREALFPCSQASSTNLELLSKSMAVKIHANTLEALDKAKEDAELWKQSEQTASDQFDKMAARADKAEAERDALTDRKTLNTIIARHFKPVTSDLGACILAGNRVCDDILALIQPEPDPLALPQDVITLVIAAREAWDEHGASGDDLDKALTPFSSRVPYSDEPVFDPLEAAIQEALDTGNDITAFEIANAIRERLPSFTRHGLAVKEVG